MSYEKEQGVGSGITRSKKSKKDGWGKYKKDQNIKHA